MTSIEEIQLFRDHSLWEAVGDLRDALKAAVGRSSQDRHTLARALATTEYLAAYREIDPHLFPSGRSVVADQLRLHIQNMSTQLEGWDQSASMSLSTMQQLDAGADQVMSVLGQAFWPALKRESRAAAIRASAEAFQISTERSLTGVEANIYAVQEQLDQMSAASRQLILESQGRADEAKISVVAIEDALRGFATESNSRLSVALEGIEDRAEKDRHSHAVKAENALEDLRSSQVTANQLRGRRSIFSTPSAQRTKRLWP